MPNIEFCLKRAPSSVEPDRWLGAGRSGPVFEMYRYGVRQWSVGIDLGAAASNPFIEEYYWFEAGVVAIGGGDGAYLVDLADGTLRKAIPVPARFGHFARVTRQTGSADELFLVLSQTGIEAFDRDFSRVWIAENLAVDGLVCAGGVVQDDKIVVDAEMDPPGGWFEVELAFSTGRELSRRPVFSEE